MHLRRSLTLTREKFCAVELRGTRADYSIPIPYPLSVSNDASRRLEFIKNKSPSMSIARRFLLIWKFAGELKSQEISYSAVGPSSDAGAGASDCASAGLASRGLRSRGGRGLRSRGAAAAGVGAAASAVGASVVAAATDSDTGSGAGSGCCASVIPLRLARSAARRCFLLVLAWPGGVIVSLAAKRFVKRST